MNPDRLLAHFDRISDAPDAIPSLRRFILDLAVRGKLVEQDPNDEPAFDLLKRIQAEKARLVKDGKISRERPPIAAAANELGFELKQGWQAARISQILVKLQTGPFGSSLHQSDYQKGGIPVINPASIKNECLVPIDSMSVGPATLERLATFKLCAGDIVMGRRGEMGRCAVVSKQEDGWLCGTGSLILRLPECVSPRFFVIVIGSPFVREYLSGSAVGATMQNLNQSILLSLVIGLPPLGEQQRIVTKVDELMALCDRLEAAQAERENRRDRLAAASLNRLNNGADAESFREHARFHLRHLPRLTTRPEHIEQLRQTILNLAVRGKLVPQDPNDEPIHVTLRRALERRATLVRMKKVRQKKIDGYAGLIKSDDLPESWAVERLGNLVDPESTISYGVLVPGNNVPDGVPFVRAQDLSLTSQPERPNKAISPEIEKAYARTRLRGGEILLCVVGSIGKLGIAPPTWAGANIARAVARILPVSEISRYYLLVVLRGRPVQTYLAEATRTLAQPTLNVGLIEQTPIPLPPLAEQHRIVAKVDELMALCDRLEAQFITTRTDSRHLLETILDVALQRGKCGAHESAVT